MPVISLRIHNVTHNITCNDGDEERLQLLAGKFDAQVKSLSKVFPNSNDTTLYLIAALTLLDKLEEKKPLSLKDNEDPLDLIVEIFEALTEKLELLTHKVEKL